MLGCLGEAFRLDGYLAFVVHEGFRALENLQVALVRNILNSKVILSCAQFLDEHLADMCATANEYSIADPFTRDLVTTFRDSISSGRNPLATEKWTNLIRHGDPGDDALEDVGYERAKITHLAANGGYLFAQTLDGSRDFFVHASATEFKPGEFTRLKLGQILMLAIAARSTLFVISNKTPCGLWSP
jgi:cold shock CspA family protein